MQIIELVPIINVKMPVILVSVVVGMFTKKSKTEIKIDIFLKWKCLFGKLLCKKCGDYCNTKTHSCCIDVVSTSTENSPMTFGNTWKYGCPTNDKMLRKSTVGAPPDSTHPCCCKCCIKIPLIELNCSEMNPSKIKPSIIKTPWASEICNDTYVTPFCCIQNCGGPQTAIIKDWVSCVLEPVAVWLKMLKFDFITIGSAEAYIFHL